MSTTVVPFPATLGEVLASGDAALTNPDVTRTRACITVRQAVEAEEQERVRLSVEAQFPAVAAFLEEAQPHPTEEPTGTQAFLESLRALRREQLEGAPPAVVAYAGQLEEYVASQPDPAQALETIADALQQEARCSLYGWCIERGEHEDHQGERIELTAPGETSPYVDAWPLSFGPGTELIGLSESDLTPAQARQEAAKLRAFADQLEGMANTLGGAR
jgi:hypothetical protein